MAGGASEIDPGTGAEPLPLLMTADQVGDLLNGVAASTVHAWARSGYMPSLKIGRHRRFAREDVLDFVERQRVGR